MKKVAVVGLLALVTGCASSVRHQPKVAQSEQAGGHSEPVVVLPSDSFTPPGTMSVSWKAPEQPELAPVEPTDMAVAPELVSNRHWRGRLVALPAR